VLAAAWARGYPAFFTRHMSLPVRLMGTAEPGERANAASVADAMAGAGMVLVAVPGTAVTDVLRAAGPLDGRVMINAAKSFGQQHRRTARRDLQGRAG
jgi:predicted dinucleotide-binding enzyme